MKNKNGLSRFLTLLAAVLLVGAVLLPIWQIQLTAPQYPEGLVMKIWANKLAGDVQIINGLNHYIGMQTLHTDDFIEFTLLPYIISGLILFSIITLFFNRKILYLTNAVLIVLVGIVSMVDFYRWEYDYGHNLNPTAPIQVPGMAYQPPLIGYKQLLNFGAFSIPDIGGWMFIASGLCIVLAWFFTMRFMKRTTKTHRTTIVATIFLLFFFTGCSQKPQPIRYGSDGCDFCKMTIMDKKFASQIVTDKGKNFRFDDIHCLLQYRKENNLNENSTAYVNDYSGENQPVKVSEAFFIKDPELKTPMTGHVACFSSQKNQEAYLKDHGGKVVNWSELIVEQ